MPSRAIPSRLLEDGKAAVGADYFSGDQGGPIGEEELDDLRHWMSKPGSLRCDHLTMLKPKEARTINHARDRRARRVTMPQMWPHPPQPGPYRPEPSKRPQYDTLESPRRMGHVDRMDTNRDTDLSAGEIEKVYWTRVTRGNGQMDEQLAAAMEEVYEASSKDPNRWHNNPAKQREALKGLGKLLDEWEAENGAFTEEELARARALKSGAIVRSCRRRSDRSRLQ